MFLVSLSKNQGEYRFPIYIVFVDHEKAVNNTGENDLLVACQNKGLVHKILAEAKKKKKHHSNVL